MKPIDFIDNFNEASYPGNLGMMEMFKFYKIATPELKDLMKRLIAAGKKQEAWELLQRVVGVSLHEETVDEAESYTEQSTEIAKILKSNGYKKLGEGADATVWIKENSEFVLKILMPESQPTSIAAEIFKSFVDFCIKNKNNKCLPKFFPVQGEYFSFFKIKGKHYVQSYMEKLKPIRKNTFQEAVVWYLSEYATKPEMKGADAWNEILKSFADPLNYNNSPWYNQAKQFALKAQRLTEEQKIDFRLLYVTMRLLYQVGLVNKYYWDLHTENVMQRSDGTLVITDPWFEKNLQSI